MWRRVASVSICSVGFLCKSLGVRFLCTLFGVRFMCKLLGAQILPMLLLLGWKCSRSWS